MNINENGIINFWQQSDLISHLVLIVLLIMSIFSWTQIATKLINHIKQKQIQEAIRKFWQSENLDKGLEEMIKVIGKDNSFSNMAQDVISSIKIFDERKSKEIGSNMV